MANFDSGVADYVRAYAVVRVAFPIEKMTPIGYSMKLQYMDELEETGEIQVKFGMKLKDGTEIALTDKKKSKGSLSCSL